MTTIPEKMLPILKDLRTKDERDLLRNQLDELEAALFKADHKVTEGILKSHFPEHLASTMRGIIASDEFAKNPEALRTFFKDLEDVIDKLPFLKLSIAFKPPEEMIVRLHDWTEQNLGPGIVIDINYDGSMLGGARIIFGGKYKEMTLAQMITDVLAKEKTAVMGMIK